MGTRELKHQLEFHQILNDKEWARAYVALNNLNPEKRKRLTWLHRYFGFLIPKNLLRRMMNLA